MEPRVIPFLPTTWWLVLALTTMVVLRQPSGVTTAPYNDAPGTAGLQIYAPPRAYLLCWKGICDPRFWGETAKRTPFYNFGLGKRSPDGATGHYDDEAPIEGDDGNNQPALYGEGTNDESGEWNEDEEGEGAEKRSKYAFGVGKKNEENRRFNFGIGKRARDFSFGLGKRPDGSTHQRFNFGIGKREINPDAYYDQQKQDDSDQTGSYHQINDLNDLYQYKRDRSYSFGLGKRSKSYNFGLGKRDRMYGFGLGKRDRMYGFGLGKRDRMYGFGLGKRGGESSGRNYGFGLGKRERMYGFGLGKRDQDTGNEYDVTGVASDAIDDGVKRSKSYAFGLGKRSTNENENQMEEKRGKFSFGLGKRNSDEDKDERSSRQSEEAAKDGKEVDSEPTKTPSFVGEHQQSSLDGTHQDGAHSHQ